MRNWLLIMIVLGVLLADNVGATSYGFGNDTTLAGTSLYTGLGDSSYVLDTATTGANAGNLDTGIVYLSATANRPP